MDMIKVMEAARQIPSLEERARKLLETGHGKDFVVDFVCREIGKHRGVKNHRIQTISDEALLQGLTSPQVENF